MGTASKLRAKQAEVKSKTKEIITAEKEIIADKKRVIEVYQNANVILGDIDRKFQKATNLNGIDLSFLFLATALQCIRQYFLTNFTLKDDRPNDKDAAKNTKRKTEEHSDRKHRYYKPSLDEIITNPVPYDTTFGSRKFNLNLGGGFGHRAKTVGHDPILGWIFGTANIATSTLTTWKFDSYHIASLKTNNGIVRDGIAAHARTDLVLSNTADKLINQGAEGKKKVGASLIKEAIHLKSDVNSKASLPIPFVSEISPKLASTLADYGIDTANLINVGKQASYSILINQITAMIHYLFYDPARDGSRLQYEVRTRKILSYSNVIASASNVIAVAITEIVAVASENAALAQKGWSYLDVGGILVTCYRLFEDEKFIRQVKQEFLEKEWISIVAGEEYKFMKEVEKNGK